MRTIIDLPEEDIEFLDTLSKKFRLSRAELIRRAVKDYLEKFDGAQDIIGDIFGTFDDVFVGDSVVTQQILREKWSDRDDYAKLLHDHNKKKDKSP